MTYFFETLGDERFQSFCQAVLVSSFPELQCLPVGQPDGGRDGFFIKPGPARDLAIFQVKYSRNPDSKTERDAIASLIRTEASKIQSLIDLGATRYFLLTNIAGTAHPGVGSIDLANAELESAIGIPSYCWWRDDIARRVDNLPGIKWSYPEILRATDVLPMLLTASGVRSQRHTDAIRSYLAYQAKYDSQLKFKQIDLQTNILDIFVDVPVHVSIPPNVSDRRRWIGSLQSKLGPKVLFNDSSDTSDEALEKAPGALQLLLNGEFSDRFGRVVIEGAPGQGKSTVTQFLCQVHRLTLLNRHSELARADKSAAPTGSRIPFRVDLRDYASWVSGRDPFSDDPTAKPPSGSTPILESFLAAQLHRFTGVAFDVEDLLAVARSSKLVIVLDGFDEVADVHVRNRIVEEVSAAATRLEATTLGSQVIVTSRPAAFANSPGFPKGDWQHLQLLPLSRPAIERYAEKWLDGRSADARERRDVMSVLAEKLNQPHIRDLARNPMQLTILLALVSTQGASLPEKRTSLYDNYIDIFLNREAEKSRVVRDHRTLLIQLHRYLAWLLQGEAEVSQAGHIAEARLKVILRDFLELNGHPASLARLIHTDDGLSPVMAG